MHSFRHRRLLGNKRSSSIGLTVAAAIHAGLLALFIGTAWAEAPELVLPAEKGPIHITVASYVPEQSPPLPDPPTVTEPKPAPPESKPAPVEKAIKKKLVKKALPKTRQPVQQPAVSDKPPVPAQPAARSTTPDPTERQRMLAQLVAAVEKNKSYPLSAKRAGITGIVYVKVRIGADGRIVSVQLTQSPHSMLANSAMATLEKVKRSWKASNWNGGALSVQIPIRYVIR